MQQICHWDTGKAPTDQEISEDKAGDWIANIIYECFRTGKISDRLPTLRIAASLHAGVRWDSTRKFKCSDSADFRHAAAAVPYFDYFLTERSLNHLLSDGNLKLRGYFPCVTLPDVSSAVSVLTSLES
jgi:hypothetical protein